MERLCVLIFKKDEQLDFLFNTSRSLHLKLKIMNTINNTVSLIGNLGVDPELIEYDNNHTLARFRVATNESYKSKEGTWLSKTTWHNIVAWGSKAKQCKEHLKKGSKIILRGKLKNSTYENAEGEKRFKTEVALQRFTSLNRKESKSK